MTRRLMVQAFGVALAGSLFGLCAGHVLLTHLDSLYSIGMALAGVAVVFELFLADRTLGRVALSEAARKAARQFLWSCVFFAMISAIFGLEVSAVIWLPSGFYSRFLVAFWGLMTCVAIFPVRRDARRFKSAVQG